MRNNKAKIVIFLAPRKHEKHYKDAIEIKELNEIYTKFQIIPRVGDTIMIDKDYFQDKDVIEDYTVQSIMYSASRNGKNEQVFGIYIHADPIY